jgi:hypothetical protein
MDFTNSFRLMLHEINHSDSSRIPLNILKLQARDDHIERDKLSDKFNRKDRSFYELYIKK